MDTDLSNNITTKTIDDEFTRQNKYPNDMGFDIQTLQRRTNDMKEMEKLYPNMTPAWLEMAWNFCEQTPKEEQDRIIREKLWEGKPENPKDTGGLMSNAMSIETPESLGEQTI
tara:strand:- start:149 stop:487 length:339 start_codon:yes stop_codon:yes gene_type:complete